MRLYLLLFLFLCIVIERTLADSSRALALSCFAALFETRTYSSSDLVRSRYQCEVLAREDGARYYAFGAVSASPRCRIGIQSNFTRAD